MALQIEFLIVIVLICRGTLHCRGTRPISPDQFKFVPEIFIAVLAVKKKLKLIRTVRVSTDEIVLF
jgi:hypothetical protein